MLSHPEDIEAHLIGQFHLLDHMPEPFARMRTGGDIRKCINADFHADLAFGVYMYLYRLQFKP